MSWRQHSACVGSELDFFRQHHFAEAKAVCASCSVRTPCLEFVMIDEALVSSGQYRFGVWGGRTPKERHELALTEPRWAIRRREPTNLEVDERFKEMTMILRMTVSAAGLIAEQEYEMRDGVGAKWVEMGYAVRLDRDHLEPPVEASAPAKGGHSVPMAEVEESSDADPS